MIIRARGAFGPGYTAITAIDGPGAEMRMDFGVLRLGPDEVFSDGSPRERVFLLVRGAVVFQWGNREERAERGSMLQVLPTALHVPGGLGVEVRSVGAGSELTVVGADNAEDFAPRFVPPAEIRIAEIKTPGLDGTADRIIRTACDDESAPYSNLAVGEVVNQPGRWSSYPPHHHPHPEIYHYRFVPHDGFGYSGQGSEVFRVKDGDTAVIPPDLSHPQVAAPGYTMLYLWAIRHLEGNRFRGDSRIFDDDHAGLRGA